MSFENFQLVDESKNDNSLFKQDFTIFFEQQGAKIIVASQGIDLFFLVKIRTMIKWVMVN